MKADVSRADLLQYLLASEQDNLALIADCFGYQYVPRLERTEEQINVINIPTFKIEATGSQPETATLRPRERFCRLTHISPSELVPGVAEDEDSRLPDWITDTTLLALDLTAPTRKAQPSPEQEPLVAWSRLWPVLRAILSDQQRKKRPDLPRLVKTIAKGYLPTRIPQQQRQNWTAELRILIDRPQRLRLFNHDFLQLLSQLKKLRGEVGIVQEMLEDYPGGPVLTGFGQQTRKQAWHMPEPETPLLILGDLGIYDAAGQAEKQWLAFGRKLQAAGCKAFVLMPAPVRYLSQDLANYYQCISWDRFSALNVLKVTGTTTHSIEQRKRQDKKRVHELLVWLSPLVELEPTLLRAIRHRLPDKPLDVSFEAQVWNHEDTASNTTYLSFSAEKLPAYRDGFMRQAPQNPAKAARFYDLVKRYHAHKFLLDYYEEINTLARAAGCVDEVLQEAERYLKQFVKAVYENEQHGGLEYHSQTLLNRQPEAIKRSQDFLSSLWGILKLRSDAAIERPNWLNTAQAIPFLNLPQTRQRYRLVQQGEKLYLGDDASLSALMNAPLFTLAEFDANSSLLVEETMQDGQSLEKHDYQLLDIVSIESPSVSEQRRLHVNGYCYTLESLPKPGWATAIGRDLTGLFVTVPWLSDNTVDLNSTEPSPEGEGWVRGNQNKEKSLFKSPHPDLLPEGEGALALKSTILWFNEPRLYWQNPTQEQAGLWTGHELLGVDDYGLYADLPIKGITQRFRWIEPGTFLMGSPETEPERYDDEVQHSVTLTQGFWLADTTVTQALWQALMSNNPSRFQEDQNNPVENVSWDDAQAFIAKLNKLIPGLQAKLPSEAQWEYACRAGTTTPFSFGGEITPEQVNYNGNYPYAGGNKGLYREKTVSVKSLPANPWGLFEMHGNVWEWCQDYWTKYLLKEPATDPTGPKTGAGGRVIRDGSWYNYGRVARSACRLRYDAGNRSDDLGFRLALGLELKSGQPSASGGDTGGRVAEQRQQPVAVSEAEAPGTLARIKDKLKKFWSEK